MKKTFVLVVLFVFPIVAYLFFASGINNFGRLPILTNNISDISSLEGSETMEGNITVLGFLGTEVDLKKGNAFNLNQKIYKPFYQFKDFQFVMVLPKGTEEEVGNLQKELGSLGDVSKWRFVYAEPDQIKALFESLRTDIDLDADLGTPYVFIVDKDLNLRGRKDDDGQGTKYGFDTSSVADLNNKMEDDVKIVLAEYRMALKKNNAERSK
ncbi:MAG: hypothetical protein V7724_18110 [Sediminicola sp.]|tara:strand:+ start:41556 stop:42188 length:633 start_codon:yes stop_codon:yes gene_type:complete